MRFEDCRVGDASAATVGGHRHLMTADRVFIIHIAGGRILIHTSCDQILALLTQMFRHHRSSVSDRVEFKHEVHIRHLRVAPQFAELLAENSRVWNGRLGELIGVSAARDASGGIALKIGEEAYSYTDIGKRQTLCYLVPRDADSQMNPHPWVYMLPIIQVVLSCCDIHVIHSAAVAHQHKALLLLGESGAGKTTLSLALARKGMTYMGDDLVAVQLRNGSVYAHALLLEPGLINHHGEKFKVDLISQEGLACQASAPVAALVNLRRGIPELSDPAPVSRAQVLSQLLPLGSSLAMTGDTAFWFDTVFEMSEQVPGWQWSPPYPDSGSLNGILKSVHRMVARE